MQTFSLSDVSDIVQGGRHGFSGNDFVEKGYPAFGAGGLNGFLPIFEFDRSAIILSAIGARCGKCFYTEGKWSSLANTQVIFPRIDRADVRFLWYQLNNEARWHRSGTAQPFIKPSDVKSSQVFLPPLPEQRRIAAILDQADALRAKRRAALAHLDEMAQAIFVEMFGDPLTNKHDWRLSRLGDLSTKFSDGPFGSNLKSSHYVEAGIRVIRLQNIGVGKFLDEDRAFISNQHFETLKRHDCRPGDVLIGTLGNPNLRAVIQPTWLTLALNKADCVQMRPDEAKVTAEFIEALLNHPSTEQGAQNRIVGQTRLRISMGRLREMEVPVPPLPLQQDFSNKYGKLEAMHKQHVIALSEADSLFASLQHQAFRGDL